MLDTLPEVLLFLTAAVTCFWHYMHVRHREGTTPSDDGVLVLTSMVVRSLAASEEVRTAVDEGLAAVPGLEGFGAKELTWLALLLRQSVFGWNAAVQRLVGDERSQQSLEAQQHERLQMLKACPDNAHGWLLYTTSCLQFQQHKLAFVFATKALVVAGKSQDAIWRPQLLLVRALAAAMGGAGATYVPRDAATALLEARATLEKVTTTWLPEPYHGVLTLGGFDRVLSELVLGVDPAAAGAPQQPQQQGEQGEAEPGAAAAERRCWESTETERQLVEACSTEATPARLDSLFTTPVPKGVPPGAVTVQGQEEESIPEGEEEAAVAEVAGQPQAAPASGGRGGGRQARGGRGTVKKR